MRVTPRLAEREFGFQDAALSGTPRLPDIKRLKRLIESREENHSVDSRSYGNHRFDGCHGRRSWRTQASASTEVPVAPPVTLTGCYIGGNIGAAFGHVSVDTPFRSSSEDNTGFAGGGQVGADYEFSGGWVIGIRDMFDGTTNHHSRTIAAGPLAGNVVDFSGSTR